jgi:hypothetical protein
MEENMSTTQTQSKPNGAAHEFANKISGGDGGLDSMSFGIGEKVANMASEIADSTTQYVKTGRDFVKDNPAKGVAYAAAAGVAAGCLLTLALTRRH